MPQENKKNTNDASASTEPLCRNCGRALTEFLHEMEEHNAEVVCPDCGKKHEPHPPASNPLGKN